MADAVLLGDADKDGAITAADEALITLIVVGMAPWVREADVQSDGVVDMGDVVVAGRIILGV